MNSFIRNIIFWTWCFPQTFLGFIYYSYTRKLHISQIQYLGSIVVKLNKKNYGGISLGKYIFIENDLFDKEIKHEYGHSLQSLYFGPFYIVIIGIPSQFLYWKGKYIFYKNKNEYKKYRNNYFKKFPENWADNLGGVKRK